MGRNHWKWVTAAMFASLLVPASPALSQQQLTTVRYQEYPGSNLHLVNWIMKEKGFCEKHQLKCETVLLANGPLAQQAAAAGSVDLIVSSMDVMLPAVANGNDLMALGTLVTNNAYVLAVRSDLV